MPGAVFGALATNALSRDKFNVVFGILLIAVAIFLALNPGQKGMAQVAQTSPVSRLSVRTVIAGACLSTVFGFVSSFLGIGGGFLYVPALVYLLRFPIHIATATSLFVLTITALTGSVTHIAAGLFHHGIRRAIGLSVGAIVGAQVAARLSRHIRGDWIIRGLASALGLVGLRLVATAFE